MTMSGNNYPKRRDRRTRVSPKTPKYTRWLITVAALIWAAAGWFIATHFMDGPSNAKPAEEQKQLTLEEQADRIVASMTAKEKVGQMVMAGIHGTEINGDSRYLIETYHFGGVCLFDRNMQSREQVKELISDLQSFAKQKQTGSLPLFVAVDEEGGLVSRMKDKLPPPKSQEALGATGEPVNAEKSAKKIGKELKEMGFNINFAPVADVGSGDGRSFSKDPEVVTKFVNAAGKGYRDAGILYTLKHFPGIGRGKVDSHNDGSKINAGKETLMQTDMRPFQSMIQSSYANTEGDNSSLPGAAVPAPFFIMVSHLTYPSLDAENPASLSSAVQTDILRGQLGWNGIIVTDDLEMGAVSKQYGFRELGVRAVQAGADIVLICHEYEHAEAVADGLNEAVENGTISEERLNESVKRIVMAKLYYLQNAEKGM